MKGIFTALTPTYAVAASSAASAAIKPTASINVDAWRIVAPSGDTTVWVGYGTTAALAQAAAVVPSAGSSSAATPVLPGSDILLNLPHGSYLSVVVATGTSTVYIQGGDAT